MVMKLSTHKTYHEVRILLNHLNNDTCVVTLCSFTAIEANFQQRLNLQ